VGATGLGGSIKIVGITGFRGVQIVGVTGFRGL